MKIFRYIAIIILGIVATLGARALDLDTYAPASRLASGTWVKISVPSNGLYCITPAQLRQWGFSNPSAVRVYGYGGNRIDNVLNAYIDDLPLVQSELTDKGIVFYALGPESVKVSANGALYADRNIYSTAGYYFLSDSDEPLRDIPVQGSPSANPNNCVRQYNDLQHYELDRVSPGESGYLLVGESFKAQPTRTFTFKAAPSDSLTLECGMVSYASSVSTLKFTINGEDVPYNSSDRLPVTNVSSYVQGTYSTSFHALNTQGLSGSQITVGITVPGASNMRDCWLDYLALNIMRPLELPASGSLCFQADKPGVAVAGINADCRIWDVTDACHVSAINAGLSGSSAQWTNDYHGTRAYALWTPSASLPAPTFVEKVANQNLHGMPCVDMVIFTHAAMAPQAKRLAAYHASAVQPLSVAVIDLDQVYNEFASGSADVSALRKCLKMLYDRGNASDSVPSLRYALLLGRATYDNRHLTSQFDGAGSRYTVPVWMTGARSSQLSDNAAYGTDDFIAMLEDNSGSTPGLDRLSIAVGRIPSHNADEAKSDMDKLLQYLNKSKAGTWRNSMVALADDGNEGVFVTQLESMIGEIDATANSQSLITKVYVDAFDIIGGSCEAGRELMYRALDEGTAWWVFNGHANNHGWTGENMLNFTDINNLYLQKLPVLLAATCDFLKWDSNTLSGCEILFHERYGGIIAAISATRPVYITDNGLFTRAFGRAVTKRDGAGLMPRLGDLYKNAKNDIRNNAGIIQNNPNRLRYVLMGDPAMPIVTPSHVVSLDSIAGQPVDPEAQVTLMALQRATISGSILKPDGSADPDFEGTVEIDIYDAERSMNTRGDREDNVKIIFEQRGEKLFSGSAPVKGGRFSIHVSMPGEVADNFRPATMNMSAYSSSSDVHAAGVNKDFYVYGLDESAPIDEVAPVIESLVLNHSTFEDGGTVNETPMVIASIKDNVGINLSMAGVGHQMTLTLDKGNTYNDVSLYFTPATDGSPSGTINYPLSALTEGAHTLKLKIWDTSGNSANKEISFNVASGLAPTIYEVYTDANPARTEANFYISHDRPDAQLTVTIGVYNLLGRPVWESTVTGRSDMFETTPVTWDLTDTMGRRVQRGVYLYRATISEANGSTYNTASRKLAVAAP